MPYIYKTSDYYMARNAFLKYGLICLVFVIQVGCVSSRLKVENQSLDRFLEKSKAFNNSFTGFSLYDPETDKYLFEYNAHKFFTPASNTKIFTFYTSKKIFSDSIPGILYAHRNDTLYFTGTGDPTFLDEDFSTQPVRDFLKNSGSTLCQHCSFQQVSG